MSVKRSTRESFWARTACPAASAESRPAVLRMTNCVYTERKKAELRTLPVHIPRNFSGRLPLTVDVLLHADGTAKESSTARKGLASEVAKRLSMVI